jgi:hypothetical protein
MMVADAQRMARTATDRRLVYARAEDLEEWNCRPLESIPVLDLRDRAVGRFDGVILDAHAERPLYIVVRSNGTPSWFLVPVGDAWFDDTERGIRIDVARRTNEAMAFEPDAFARMTPDEAIAYERRVLGTCCPEVGLHHDGTPDYSKAAAFQCPAWLK